MQARNIANRSKKFYAVKRTIMAAAPPSRHFACIVRQGRLMVCLTLSLPFRYSSATLSLPFRHPFTTLPLLFDYLFTPTFPRILQKTFCSSKKCTYICALKNPNGLSVIIINQ